MTLQKGFKPAAAESADMPALKSMWKTVFGDTDADIDRFFDIYFSPGRTAVVRDGGQTVSAAYILPVGSLALPDGARVSCAMLYAIATLPGHRGRGFGGAVTRAAASAALEQGFSAVVLKPDEPSLFSYYETHTDFAPFFEAAEAEFTPDTLPAEAPGFSLAQASPGEYRRLRQNMLAGSIYIDADERALSYQQQLCVASGCGLHVIGSGDDAIGCAIVERDGDSILVKELLLSCGHDTADATAAIARRYMAGRYVVRYPENTCLREPEKSRPFGMILPKPKLSDFADMHFVKWYGPAFDQITQQIFHIA